MHANMNIEAKPKPERFRIRVRRTIAGDGDQLEEMTVYCPYRERSVTISECSRCESCEGLSYDPIERSMFLHCGSHLGRAAPSVPPAPPAEWSGHRSAPAPPATVVTAVSAVMSRGVYCVRSDVSVEALTALLLEHDISGVPVVDDQGRPVGMVSKTDLVRASAEGGSVEEEESAEPLRGRTSKGYEVELGPGFHAERIGRATVADIMTRVAFSLPESAPIGKAAALMAHEGVHRVPIVSIEGKVVGVLSALDVMAWLADREGYAVSRPPRPVKGD